MTIGLNKIHQQNTTPALKTFVFLLGLLAFALLLGPKQTLAVEHDSNLWAQHDPASTTKVNHKIWGRILGTYVETDEHGQNLFNYAGVSPADKRAIKHYIEQLSLIDVPTLNRNEQLALWLNLYNAIVIDIVLDEEPVNSILHIKGDLFTRGPWKVDRVTINGHTLNLDTIRHDIIFANWEDIRTLYAMSCGAKGCPNIGSKAMWGKNIDGALEAATLTFINSPKAVFEFDGKGVEVSKLYYWARREFRKNKIKTLDHIKSYAVGSLARKLENSRHISGHEFNWEINSTSDK